MPFSASTCLTNAGSTPLGPVLSAYTDTDSYLNPFSSVLLTQITGGNCPYIFTGIPDGTTNIRLIDPTNSCCITIPIQSDNFCDTCDLDFTTYPLNTNSQIIAGDLTGSCQGNISDYVINWFGPNSATNIAFRSGKGNTFSYQFTHPLTGSGFVFAQAGTYTPVIDRVIISGYTFSNTGGTGTYDATLDCFQDVQVNPLTCDNGNTPLSAYTHSYYFSGTGASSIPLNVTFQLSANTNYFAYSFTGKSVPDRLKITYSGGTTPSQVILEDITIGSTLQSNSFSWGQPRQNNSEEFKKVLCLTGLTRIPNDSLTIQITPNPGNTEWALNLRCFSSFDCTTCQQNLVQNNIYQKIIASSITVVTASCYTNIGYKITGCTGDYNLTSISKYWTAGGGSGVANFSAYIGANAYSIDNNVGIIPRSGTTFTNLNYINATNNLSRSSNACQNISLIFGGASSFNCILNPPSGTISFTKYVSGGVGRIDMTFSNLYYLTHYYTGYTSQMAQSVTWGISACSNTSQSGWYPNVSPTNPVSGPFSGGPSTGGLESRFNPQDMRYYSCLLLCIPSATGGTCCYCNTAENLGTTAGFIGNAGSNLAQCYIIHPSATVTTGGTGPYTMSIVMNTITNGIVFSQCEGINTCNAARDGVVNGVNGSSTGTTNNITFTSTSPAAFSNPWSYRGPLYYQYDLIPPTNISCRNTFRFTNQAYVQYSDQMNFTVPQNPANNQALTIYSAVTCQNFPRTNQIQISPTFFSSGSTNITNNLLYTHSCYVELLNEFVLGPSSEQVYRNYEIYCLPITNGLQSGINAGNLIPTVTNPNWQLAYRYRFPPFGTGQEFCNSTYVIC